MRFIDAHLHTDMIEDKQLQKLVMMGMEAAVVPSPHMFLGQRDADAVLLLWERFLGMETTTAKTLGFELFTSLSVPFFGVEPGRHREVPGEAARVPRERPGGGPGRDRSRHRDRVREGPVPRASAHRQGPRSAGDPPHPHPPGPAGQDGAARRCSTSSRKRASRWSAASSTTPARRRSTTGRRPAA